MSNLRLYIFLVLITPVFWSIIFGVPLLIDTWKTVPTSIHSSLSSLFAPDRLKFIEDSRWESQKHPGNKFLSRVFYSKPTSLVDDFFSYIAFLSPRIYFQAGDGQGLSPKGVEPMAIILFPLWILGLIKFVANKKFLPIWVMLIFGLIAYIIGQNIFAFTFPLIFVNLYVIKEGFEMIKNKKIRKSILVITLIYGIYIIGRSIWIV